MTATELAYYVGKQGMYRVKTMRFLVNIVDARNRFDLLDLFIQPVNGDGGTWVIADSVKVLDPAPA